MCLECTAILISYIIGKVSLFIAVWVVGHSQMVHEAGSVKILIYTDGTGQIAIFVLWAPFLHNIRSLALVGPFLAIRRCNRNIKCVLYELR